jgi:acetyl esterase/lipase
MLEAELNDGFERTDVVYQTLDGIPFEVSILAPRSIILTSSSPRPLLVHFHGGGFVLGTAFDPEITPKWQGTLATSPVTVHLLTSK